MHYCSVSVQMQSGLNFISLINCFFITKYIILYYTVHLDIRSAVIPSRGNVLHLQELQAVKLFKIIFLANSVCIYYIPTCIISSGSSNCQLGRHDFKPLHSLCERDGSAYSEPDRGQLSLPCTLKPGK